MLTFCRRLVLCSSITFLAASCSRADRQELSKPEFDSGFSVGMDGVISDGVLITPSNNPNRIISSVKDQLYYTMGSLNAFSAVADLNRSVVSVNEVLPLSGGLFEAHYAARLFVSWPRNATVPASFSLVMPAQMEHVQEFMTDNVDCREDFSHEAEVGNFWYFYRPEAFGCPLREGGVAGEDPLKVRRFGMTMSVSADNTSGKFPEYDKVWQDGQLIATTMFGKYEEGATSLSDPGIAEYNEMYRRLRQTYGTPVSQSVVVPDDANPGPQIDDVEMTFNTARGPLKVSIMLIEGVRSMTSAQISHYNERTRDADYVSYSGHSGLGANIRALARMGSFQRNQYQLFFVNGCDTFAYVDNSLRDAHAAVNPGEGINKYFDIITNSMPSYADQSADSNVSVISALINQQLTYRDILGQIDPAQMPVVTGEEDNAWTPTP